MQWLSTTVKEMNDNPQNGNKFVSAISILIVYEKLKTEQSIPTLPEADIMLMIMNIVSKSPEGTEDKQLTSLIGKSRESARYSYCNYCYNNYD